MGMSGDVKIVGRAMPRTFEGYELGVKGNAPADGELVYEMDELPPEAGDETRSQATERESARRGRQNTDLTDW